MTPPTNRNHYPETFLCFFVGRSTAEVTVHGCYDCGKENSEKWHIAQTVEMKIGSSKPRQVQVFRCDECHGKAKSSRR